MIYVILELSLHRNKCQSVNSMMKRMGLHLGTPEDHPKMLTDMRERYLHMLVVLRNIMFTCVIVFNLKQQGVWCAHLEEKSPVCPAPQ